MTLSVGLGKIINDPKASILTRKALGALSKPGLLVLDKGLTINNDGRFTLRLAAGAGLSEDANGLAVLLAPGGGLTSSAAGLAVTGGVVFGDITVNSIHVLADANVDGAVNSVSVNTGAIASTSINNSGDVTSGSVSTGLVTSSSVNTGAITSSSLSTGAIFSSSVNTGAISATIATLTGTLSAGDVTAGTGQLVGGGLRIGGGTTLLRMLSFFFNVNVPVTIGPHNFSVFTPGAIFQDGVLVTLVATDFWSGRISGWSGVCESNDFATIRVMCTGGGATTLGFRVTIFGFA